MVWDGFRVQGSRFTVHGSRFKGLWVFRSVQHHKEYFGLLMGIRNFDDIEAWQLARALTREVYRVSKQGDFGKDFGLRDQIQRAASSAMHNIAEGFDSESNTEFIRFLRYAKRSCSEVQSQHYIALDNT